MVSALYFYHVVHFSYLCISICMYAHVCHCTCVEAKKQVVNYLFLIKWILEIKLRSPAWWQAPLHAEPPSQSIIHTLLV